MLKIFLSCRSQHPSGYSNREVICVGQEFYFQGRFLGLNFPVPALKQKQNQAC